MAIVQHAPQGIRRREAPPLSDRIDSYFAALGQGFNAYVERVGRMDEIRRLEAMTDEQLLARGITRERIPHHVFRDMFCY